MFGEIGAVGIVVAWIGSMEIRIRNFVTKREFDMLDKRTCRIEKKVDAVLTHGYNLDPEDYNDDSG